MSGIKHKCSRIFIEFSKYIAIPLFLAAPIPLVARTVKFATYSTPYLTENTARDAAFNKYRRAIIASIAEIENWKVIFVDDVPEGDEEALKRHDVDVLCSARRSMPQEGFLSNKPLYMEYDVVVARETDRRFINGDLSALDGAHVGYYGKTGVRLMTRFMDICHAAGTQIKDINCLNAEQMEDALKNGDVDLCVMGIHDVPYGFKVVYNMGSEQIYFLAWEKDVKDEIDHAMNALEADAPFYIPELIKRVGGSGALISPNFTAREIAFIKHSQQSPCIVVTVHSNSMPFSDIDVAGNFTGLDAILWQKLSNISGLQFHYLDADKYERREEIDYLRIANANGWRTHADYKRYTPALLTRHEKVYARPGYNATSFLRGGPDAEGRGKNGEAVIAIIREQRAILPFIDRWCKEYEVLLCDSLRDCLEKTSEGTADIAIINEAFLRSMHNINEYPRLANKKPLDLTIPVSIEIKGPHSDLIDSILNKSLCQIPIEYFDHENIVAEIEMGYVPSRHTTLSHTVAGTVMFLFLLGGGLLICTMVISYRYKVRSETDEATGFPNLAKFQTMAERLLHSCDNVIQSGSSSKSKGERETNGIFILTSISILGFRHLNNTFGFEWGRRLLRIVADYMRHSDTSSPMLITHCYDDIFYCLIKSYDKERSTFIIATNIANINETLVKAGYHVVVKSSAVYSNGYESIQSMMDKADYARESVSSEATSTKIPAPMSNIGRGGNFAVFDDTLQEERENENNIERHIVSAFNDNEITALYQPKIDLRTGRLEGAEAFARWNSPELGIVMPNVFLPVFEKNGYALRLNFTIFSMVLSFLQSIIDRGDTPLPISMNVTHINIKSETFVRRFGNLFSRFSVPQSLIEFELSEKSLGMSSPELRRLSALLHEGGFSVAIDDFGTGGSSLSMLGTVPADVIKFDQRLLSYSDTSNGPRIILTKLIEMGHQLGRRVVCKCVEKKTQVDFLRSIGCDMVQGFYYSAPLPPEEFKDYMDASI